MIFVAIGDIATNAGNMLVDRAGAMGDVRGYASSLVDRNFSPETAAAIKNRAYQVAGFTPYTAVARDAPTSGDVYGTMDTAAARYPSLHRIIDALQGR